jgi:hypothetical protein
MKNLFMYQMTRTRIAMENIVHNDAEFNGGSFQYMGIEQISSHDKKKWFDHFKMSIAIPYAVNSYNMDHMLMPHSGYDIIITIAGTYGILLDRQKALKLINNIGNIIRLNWNANEMKTNKFLFHGYVIYDDKKPVVKLLLFIDTFSTVFDAFDKHPEKALTMWDDIDPLFKMCFTNTKPELAVSFHKNGNDHNQTERESRTKWTSRVEGGKVGSVTTFVQQRAYYKSDNNQRWRYWENKRRPYIGMVEIKNKTSNKFNEIKTELEEKEKIFNNTIEVEEE